MAKPWGLFIVISILGLFLVLLWKKILKEKRYKNEVTHLKRLVKKEKYAEALAFLNRSSALDPRYKLDDVQKREVLEIELYCLKKTGKIEDALVALAKNKDKPKKFDFCGTGCLLILLAFAIVFFIVNPEFLVFPIFIVSLFFLAYLLNVVSKRKDKREITMLKKVFSAENIYQEALSRGKEDLLIKLFFYELFVTHCIEIWEQKYEGRPQYFYKIAPTVDISLLNEVEQIIVSEMLEFTSLEELIEKSTKKLRLLGKDKIIKNLLSTNPDFSTQKNVDDLIRDYQAVLNKANTIYRKGGCF